MKKLFDGFAIRFHSIFGRIFSVVTVLAKYSHSHRERFDTVPSLCHLASKKNLRTRFQKRVLRDALDTFNASMLANIIGGQLKGNPCAEILRARADSRICRAGDLFVALPGEHRDGNMFVDSAWNSGAEVVLAKNNTEWPEPPPGKALVLVDDTQVALHTMASVRRDAAPKLDVVGITGSNGKTTTKNILAAIMIDWLGKKVLVTPGNYNSDIGNPLTLVDLRTVHEIAVLEMGMNRIGEIALLTELLRPRVCVITNIGRAHIGHLGSVEAIAREKKAILGRATSSSVAIVGVDESWKDYLLKDFPGDIRFYGHWGEHGWNGFEDWGCKGFLIKRYNTQVEFALPGRHNLLNAMAAVEAAITLGAPESSIVAGLESVKPAAGRCEIIEGKITVIRDFYNANPESLYAALDFFKTLTFAGRRIVVLGEILELGVDMEPSLKTAGRAIADVDPDAVFFFGITLSIAKEALLTGGYTGLVMSFHDIDQLSRELSEYMEEGDGVLLKGSRGNALERLNHIFVSSEK